MGVFVNWSNHPSEKWDERQKEAASRWGDVIDRPFPEVNPKASIHEIGLLAQDIIDAFIAEFPNPDKVVIMLQGEMTLLYQMLRLLEGKRYRVVAATTIRSVFLMPDGSEMKKFEFYNFRDYFLQFDGK